MTNRVLTIAWIVVALGAIAGCAKADAPAPASSNVINEAATNLTAVSAAFSPQSLSYSSLPLNSYLTGRSESVRAQSGGVGGISQAQSGNPCAPFSGPTALFDCQPVLLRLYIDMSKQFLDMATLLITDVGKKLGSLADGATGSVENGAQTIFYSRTSATQYSALIKEGANPVAYLSAVGNVYTLQFDFSKMSSIDGTPPSQMEFKLTYTDANTWSIVTTGLGSACSPDDVRAPRQFKILMSKANGLWNGKAMLYNGVWATGVGGGLDPTCSTVDSDAASMALYTDFVGDQTAAKANIYMMKRTISSVAAYTPLKDFCTTYGIAGCATWFTSANFSNSFCNLGTTVIATWNDSCASQSPAVAAASFGPASDWVVPADFSNTSITAITLPTTL
ncbi:hypothetical protein WDW37_15460 [Bdellovibrionota bacterium FG-1]